MRFSSPVVLVPVRLLAALTLMAASGAGSPSWAAPKPVAQGPAVKVQSLTLPLGRSAVIEAVEPMASLINPNPKLINTEVSGRRKLVVFGMAEGTTELRLINAAGAEFEVVEIEIVRDLQPLQALMDEALGSTEVKVRQVGSTVVLSGEVASPGEIGLAADVAQKAVGANAQVLNLIKHEGGDQITLAVRVLEIKTSKLKSLGLKWSAQNAPTAKGIGQIGNVFNSGVLTRPTDQFSLAGSTTFTVGKTVIDAFVDFLRTEGQAQLLAEPTIVATSGKGAKFLAGGEFPVPVPYGLGSPASTTSSTGVTTTTATNTFQGIVYKQYGISLAFNATIDPTGKIDLHVAPEVSSIDYVNSIEYGGNRVPAIATRRAETDLRLSSGETVIFAGLTSRTNDKESSRLPFGGTRLFDFLAGPQQDSSNETELIIIVTPTVGAVVQPGRQLSTASDLHVPR